MNYHINTPIGYEKPTLPGGKKWTAALRSGEYRQGQERLCTALGEMCCLGVLSKLQGRLDLEGHDGDEESVLDKSNPMYHYFAQNGTLPSGVVVLIYAEERTISSQELTSANDSGLSFNEIADIIEAIWDCTDEKLPR